jgi:OOP family OmpA-OmpF porin
MDHYKQGLMAVVTAGAALASGQTSAEIYVGASIGEATLESNYQDTYCYYGCSLETIDFEGNDTAFKVFGGYMFNEYVGIEAGYIDMGTMDDRQGLDKYTGYDGGETLGSEVDITGYTVQLVGQYPIGPVDLFAKVGFLNYDEEAQLTWRDPNSVSPTLSVASSSYGYCYNTDDAYVCKDTYGDEGNDLAWGVGASYNVGDFGVRAEYEAFDLKGDYADDLYMWSIGVEYHIK